MIQENKESHPEKMPSLDGTGNLLTSIPVKLGNSVKIQREIESRHSALEDRLNNLIRRSSVGEIPILALVLQVTKNPKELITLGKCLERTATFIEDMEKLNALKQSAVVMEKEPNLFASLFGDINSLVPEDIEGIDNL